MYATEPKKLALIRILNILERNSDANHPLTQEDIAKYLEDDYGLTVERKAISRNISLLKEAGYDIESGRNGSYLRSRRFEESELRMLIDAVLSSKYITARHSKDLIEKLCGLANKYFRTRVKNIHSVNDWNKTDNQNLFYNIEVTDEAIENSRQIFFSYNHYGIDKKLHHSANHTVSPYLLILHNQRYYLMAYDEHWRNMVYYRLDHITNIQPTEKKRTPLKSIKGYENGINYKEISTSLPYMFSDKIEPITFYAEENIIDQIIEWFGSNAKILKQDNKLRVIVKASPNAMEYWAMQYLNYIEIITPVSLRERIRENLIKGSEKYSR
ncbi:MAG: helix-turn-helix transcriptional regulator [Oscillospiraceae bacterium]